ncbi:hypothetical protein CBOM_01517 [Ceraceosorus bombacis]|uniref:Uncharacterized protein n=1 Tax=Ceraceosorus bombacis TaxID=401625 RepID=A0A0P1BC67_9BASI|nr:hypothetical protein CBOM_01517 [Ceraceosorus bombacis]
MLAQTLRSSCMKSARREWQGRENELSRQKAPSTHTHAAVPDTAESRDPALITQ